ncbi:hypothetical protein [Pinibacter aurantiacus]|uniref:Uncharacterized protein n=1 Tax=Pinibacter aurantiacus TaxID=2851599 RepID=A0A9E2W7G5_9BACT|nr:hypothetical protein [Pinibacter aurantiacus]MBV4356641.1 hypothetical protein [Pinibacter aurantiacus]
MKTAETLLIALRIWFFSVIITSAMVDIAMDGWLWIIPIVLVGTIITLPVPFFASYCIKLAFEISGSFSARFMNTVFFLILLAGLFWAILIAFLGGGMEDMKVLIGASFLSILIACIFSIKQLKNLNHVISEETVIS